MSSNVFKESTRWFIYSEYKIEVQENEKIIMPASGAELDYYDPMDYSDSPTTMQQAPSYKNACELPPTPQLSLARLDTNDESDILAFCNRWGLLGLWKEPRYSDAPDMPEKDFNTYLDDHASEWYFHPHRRFRMQHNRQEPLKQFQKAVEHYQETFNLFMKLDEAIMNRAMWQGIALSIVHEFNSMLKSVSPNITWNEEGEKSFLWNSRSLLSAIYLLTYLDIQKDREYYKCENPKCREIYIRSRRNRRYCSFNCRNSKKNEKNRNKKYKQEIKDEIIKNNPTVNELWLESQVDNLLGQPGVGKTRALRSIESQINEGGV